MKESLEQWNLNIALKVSTMVSEYADKIEKSNKETWEELLRELEVFNDSKPIVRIRLTETTPPESHMEAIIRSGLLYPTYVYLRETLDLI